MKIITKCVIDMATLQIVEEESFEYDGPVAMCKGGGGSTSGEVGYPEYMEETHAEWLNDDGADSIAFSMTDAMNAALGSSPFEHALAYDPSADINDWELALDAFKTILQGLSDSSDWSTIFNSANNTIGTLVDTEIADAVDAYGDILDDEIETKVLPRFRRGMHNINAVVSSAFPIGESIIEASRNRDVAKFQADLAITMVDKKAGLVLMATDQVVKMMYQRLGLEENYVRYVIESNRLKIVAKTEQEAADVKYDEEDMLWDLRVFEYGGNLLAAIGGGTVQPGKGASQSQSALGGALSGAAAGAMATGGNPIGIIAGGVLGAASAFL